jgi:aconitate hydratase
MMGVLPLQFLDNENAETLGLSGYESFSIELPENPKIHEKNYCKYCRKKL